ncbi:hypothetical protein AB0D32_31030 [Micromonospora sp. NPDC048170]|uniref:hypothetical protein n=1 Tax=Micromonospora sp. NPDC048170 TaxID=3154819 RepID=UPI0033EF8F9C
MSGEKRRKEDKRRRLRRAKQARAAGRDLPRPIRLALEGFERLVQYAELGGPEAAAALAAARLTDAAQRIARLTAQCDAFDVLEYVRLDNAIVNPETFQETEHEGSAAVIELVALIMAARGSRAASAANDEDQPVRPEQIVEDIQIAAREAFDAGSMLIMFASALDADPLRRLSFGARLREVSVRNVAYGHMVEDTLTALFDQPAVQDACCRVMGCTVRQIRDVFSALHALHNEAWHGRFAALRELGQLADSDTATADDLPPDVVAQALHLSALWDNPAACSAFTDEVIARKAGIDVETVRTVLDLFTTPLVQRPSTEVALEFFQGRSPLRVRPILQDPDGSFVVVHGGLLIPAIRERVEEALRLDQRAWDVYSKHRGQYVERAAADLVAAHLPGCVSHLGLEHFVPATGVETEPARYTKVVEGDGLLICDDVAIIIESKAVALRAQSRTGDPLRLRQDLRRIVTDAANQSERLRRRILDDGGLRLRDQNWLDLSGVREVHAIAVSLEDLSGIATVTSDLVAAGLLTDSALPWTVSLHDLRIISELIDRPAELLLYLRRRTEPDITRWFHAVDELDFYLHFLAAKLYAEPDPDVVHRELPQLGAPRVRDRRKYRKQQLELLTSRTDALDAWYMHRLGYRRTPADKPRLMADRGLLQLVDNLTARAEPGWLAMSATLLGGDTPTQRRWAGLGERLAGQTRADGRPHSAAMPGGTRRGDSFVLVWMTHPPYGAPTAAHAELARYASAKKHQWQLDRSFGLLYDGDTGALVATAYDNRLPGPDPQLDAVVTNMGLMGIEALRTIRPVPTQR